MYIFDRKIYIESRYLDFYRFLEVIHHVFLKMCLLLFGYKDVFNGGEEFVVGLVKTKLIKYGINQNIHQVRMCVDLWGW